MDDKKRCPSYFAVIPANVLFDRELTPQARLLYGVIASYSRYYEEQGCCFASNTELAESFGVDGKTISRSVSQLAERGYIHVAINRGNKGQVEGREIYLSVSTVDGLPVDKKVQSQEQKCPTPQDKNVQSNNIYINKKAQENKPGRPRQKDFAPMEQFTAWLERAVRPDNPYYETLLIALDNFCRYRAEIKDPLKSQQAVTALCNRLSRYSDGAPAAMVDMLECAMSSGWKTVYALKQLPQSRTPQNGGQEEWL